MENENTSPEPIRSVKARLRWKQAMKWCLFGVAVILAALLLVFAFRISFLRVYDTAMEPTLTPGDTVLVLPAWDYTPGDPVAFTGDGENRIRRIIAGPGSTVDMDSQGRITVDGQPLAEDYVSALSPGICDVSFPLTVPQGHYFLLGDHRESALDSRWSGLGCIPKSQILGKILVIPWLHTPIPQPS